MRFQSDLHQYQLHAIEFIKQQKRCLLAIGMGCGKTCITLTAVNDLIDSFTIHKTLIIAPLRVANSVWAQEATLWEHTKHLKVSVCTGSERQRLTALMQDADIFVINRENVEWLIKIQKKWRFDCIVVDESDSFKNASSKRFKALRKVLPDTTHMILLSGTPSPNGLLDIWAQMYLIDFGERLGRTMTSYKDRFFEKDYMGYNFTLRDGSADRIHNLLRDKVLSMSSEDYLELPDRISLIESVELPHKVLREYKDFESTLLATLPDGEEIEAMNAAVLAGKLLQYANGAMYTDEHHNWSELHDVKLDALAEIVENNGGENILVAYNFKHDLARLQQRFPSGVVLDNDPNTITRWQRGNIKLMFAHPQCLHPSTEVLTEYRGWIKIIDVKVDERVFDGVEFVTHSGCHYSGYKEVINVFGITMTPEHKLFIDNKWEMAKNVKNIENARKKALYTYGLIGDERSAVLTMWGSLRGDNTTCTSAQSSWQYILSVLHQRFVPQYDRHPNLENMALNEVQSKRLDRQGLRWSWNINVSGLARLQTILQRYARWVFKRIDIRANRCKWELLKRKLYMGFSVCTASKQANKQGIDLSREDNAFGRSMSNIWGQQNENAFSFEQRYVCGRSSDLGKDINVWDGKDGKEKSHVYDLVDCGPRHQFLIRNSEGNMFISHNSAGHGLNLQDGGCLAVWFGLTWSLGHYQQFNARLHRQGQQRPVRIIHIIASDTIDERVVSVLTLKGAVQNNLLNALKRAK